MKIKEYLKDKKFLILFYIILMSFISSVIYLDHKTKITLYNLLYINFVSFIFFFIYITVSYLYKRRYYNLIYDIVKYKEEDIINSLPNPKNYEQHLYNTLLKKIYEKQNMQIEQLHEEKRENIEFINTWVHEIKTPIAVSRLIMENSTSKPLDKVLNDLEDEIDKIEGYFEQSLYYSKLDSFSKDYFIKEIDMQKLMREIIKRYAKTFINKQIKLEIDDSSLIVYTDKKWIEFIINQILSNSLKYTNKKGTIKITFEKEKDEQKLIIEDNGIGIKPEDIGRVFDKGFTGYTGRQYSKSTGMGLYLVKKLSKKLGHNITIDSLYGNYTKVTIHFLKITDYFTV